MWRFYRGYYKDPFSYSLLTTGEFMRFLRIIAVRVFRSQGSERVDRIFLAKVPEHPKGLV